MPRLGSLSLKEGFLLTYVSFFWNSAWNLRLSEAKCSWKWEAKPSSWTCSFINLKLRAFLVIDLKMDSFRPEYAGKMGFYLSAVDDMLRQPDDKPTIGLILCKDKNGLVAEYALRNSAAPLGIAEFTHLETSLNG